MGNGWRDIVRDGVATKAADARKRSARRSPDKQPSRIGFSVEAHPFLVRAANLRGMSISGYIRRATMTIVAQDLGMDPKEIFAVDMPLTPRGMNGRWQSTLDLDGELFGRWEVGASVLADDDHS